MTGHGKISVRLILYMAIAISIVAVAWWAIRSVLKPSVTVTRMTRGPVVQAFYATGTVQPQREYPIRAPVVGTLEKVLVDKGDTVKAGQPLAVIHDPMLKFRADRAQAMLDEKAAMADERKSPALLELDARINSMQELLTISKRELDRLTQMTANNAASSVDLDRAMDQYQTRVAEQASLRAQRTAKVLELNRELKVAQAELDSAMWDMQQQTLSAPIDGVVLDRPMSQGTRVAINDMVMRMADVRPANLLMRAAVDEEDVTNCRIGQVVKMSLYAFGNRPITGKVMRVYNEADKDRRTFEVDVALDQGDLGVAAGMTGELAFIIDEKRDADVLPSTAVQQGAVYLVRDGRIVRSDARIGLRSVQRVEVLSGLGASDRVLISPVGEMQSGQTVRVTEIDPKTAVGLIEAETGAGGQSDFKGFN